MDDSPINNKPPPLTATRAVKKQWLFKVAESVVVNYIVEDANRFNQFTGKTYFKVQMSNFVETFTSSLAFLPCNLCYHPVDN